jgi:carbon-monoxide dehydrogenase small subunit
MTELGICVEINGKTFERTAPPRLLLADFLRHEIGLKGTHIGCAHGVCGACTVLLDGRAARSCLTFAVQVDGMSVTTVEGLAGDGPLTPVQKAFHECHALQCGFCTPGMLITVGELLRHSPNPADAEIREWLDGNLCRCTGYVNIVKAVRIAAKLMHSSGPASI